VPSIVNIVKAIFAKAWVVAVVIDNTTTVGQDVELPVEKETVALGWHITVIGGLV
jgi:hypothetical protein